MQRCILLIYFVHAASHLAGMSAVTGVQVYMDSIRDLLWDEQQGARPKLEVRMGAFGTHLPGLTEKQVIHSCERGSRSAHHLCCSKFVYQMLCPFR